MYGGEDPFLQPPHLPREIDGGGAVRMGVADDVPGDAGSMPEALQSQAPATSNQLTLSFQGDVYVFDSVQPERTMSECVVGLEESIEWIEIDGSFDNLLDELLLGLDGLQNSEESRPQDRPEEPESNCKRQKIDSCANMTGVSSPLGLNLHKNQTFLDLIHMKLREAKTTPHNEPTVSTNIEKQKTRNDNYNTRPTSTKWKASNFPATKLKIGCWERKSRNEGDIVAKFYYAKRKLVWEILENGLKKKIEIQWSDISAIRARVTGDQHGILEVELRQQPVFFNEVNPQPRKHTNWEACSDFTGGNATMHRCHYLEFREGILEKHYERLLCSDNWLSRMSQRAFPSLDSSFFGTVGSEMQDIGMLKPRFPSSFNQPSSNWYPPHLHHINNQGSMNAPTCIRTFESLGPSISANYSVSLQKTTAGAIQMYSPCSDNFALNNGNSTMNPILDGMTQPCNQEIQSSRRVFDIREHQSQKLSSENFHADMQDLQSIDGKLLSDSSDLDAGVSDESRLLSKVKFMGSQLYLTAAPDSQPSSSSGLDNAVQSTDGTNSTLELSDSKQFDNKEQIGTGSLFKKFDRIDLHSMSYS